MLPEIAARSGINALLEASGWTVQPYLAMNLAEHEMAGREFPLKIQIEVK